MVSFYLLHRGLSYFTLCISNTLPLIKHAMDTWTYARWTSHTGCNRPVFRYTCFDDLAVNYRTEAGLAGTIALLTVIIAAFHTLLATFHFLAACSGRNHAFIPGTEFGCCGAAAVIIAVVAVDGEVDEGMGRLARGRKHVRLITAALQVPIIIAAGVGMHMVSIDSAPDDRRGSLCIFLVVLLLNLASFIENAYEGILAGSHAK
ncbi:hypothetical protein HKX48_007142 [Thoreauomyces humboldtii]|nr:hypothetical protein HKX48_007142 [Thoreauomyces humboldtii]